MSEPADTIALLVEDSDDDVVLFRRALRKSGSSLRVEHVEDGLLAQQYLAGESVYADRQRHPLPSLLLLDLKLPLVSGHEVLRWIRSRAELDRLCIVVLTSSAEPSDVEKAFALGANCYLTKPVSPETLSELLNELDKRGRDRGSRALLNVRGAEAPLASS